jgi:hypothetical protein
MVTKFIHLGLSGLERRPMVAVIMVYWIALAMAALSLGFALRDDAGARAPYLPAVASLVTANSLV